MILVDRRISSKETAETLETSFDRVGFIIHDVLDMRKLSAKWMPKGMNADKKRDRVVASQEILEHCRRTTPGFLARLVTMDETWKRLYNPQIKEHSKEWRHGGSLHPKKFRT
jgi:hypothetical protein